jgi:hypothetical protein
VLSHSPVSSVDSFLNCVIIEAGNKGYVIKAMVYGRFDAIINAPDFSKNT